jgi:hypothetical protein
VTPLTLVQAGTPDTGRMGTWLVILLAAPGLFVIVAVVMTFLLRRRGKDAGAGPGYYHVMGFDKATQASRQLTLQADSPAAARGRAEMEGIIATDVKRVEDST